VTGVNTNSQFGQWSNSLSDNEIRPVVAAAADLLFAARIRSAAEAAGVPLMLVRGGEDVAERAREARARLVLLDLDARWLDAPAVIGALKEVTTDIPVVAYVSHVREDAIAAARMAGADRVLARSAFVRLLPELLRGGPAAID
jgi:CheY-like chemotaxis protein